MKVSRKIIPGKNDLRKNALSKIAAKKNCTPER